MAGFGGACIRFAAEESTSIDALESGFWKTISYSFLLWWLAVRNCQDDDYVQNMNKCESYSGSDQVRVVFVGAHTIWIILRTIGVVSGHPLVWLCKKILLGRVMTFSAYFFTLDRAITITKTITIAIAMITKVMRKLSNQKRKIK